MKNSKIVLFFALVFLIGAIWDNQGASNFDRVVLGVANYGTDPNPTTDLTFQNGEYISNETNRILDFGNCLFKVGALCSGLDTFKTVSNSNKFTDTVAVLDLVATDIVFVTSKDVTPVAGDQVSVQPATDKFIVHRADTTTANLPYTWFAIKK